MVLKIFEVGRRMGNTQIYACVSLRHLVEALYDTIGEDGQYTSEVTGIKELHQNVIVLQPMTTEEQDG